MKKHTRERNVPLRLLAGTGLLFSLLVPGYSQGAPGGAAITADDPGSRGRASFMLQASGKDETPKDSERVTNDLPDKINKPPENHVCAHSADEANISPKRLFKGQNNHPLSPAEKKAFAQKFQFDEGTSPDEKKKVYAALKEMMNYPTGREQIRQIIAYEKKAYTIKVENLSSYGSSAEGLNKIYISRGVLDDPKQCGSTLLHEFIHQRQKYPLYTDNMNVDQIAGYELLIESETQALNVQLQTEENYNIDRMYQESYEKNLAKWRKIAAGEQKRPQGIPPLVYARGLTDAEKAQAREAYAQQLASLETRAIAIKEFIKPFDELDESLQSYYNLYRKLLYMRGSMNIVYNYGRAPYRYKNPEGDPEAYTAHLKDIISRNRLFLTVEDLKKATISGNNDKEKIGFMSIARETQARFIKGEGETFHQVFDKVLAEKQNEGKPIEKFQKPDSPRPKESNEQKVEITETDPIKMAIQVNESIINNTSLYDTEKQDQLLYFIKQSKDNDPDKREDRTDAIKKLRELTGNPNLPIVKEASVDTQIKDSLRKAHQRSFEAQQEMAEEMSDPIPQTRQC